MADADRFYACVYCARSLPVHDELEKLRQRCEELENRWAAVFDGPAVFRMLTPRAAKFVSPECVSEVLDALVRVSANAAIDRAGGGES